MTAEELLAGGEVYEYSNLLAIDAETREINIPLGEEFFGVEGDKDVERKYFSCPKIVGDNIDLSECNIYSNYVLADKEGNPKSDDVESYFCDDMMVDGDNIKFTWKLSERVLKEDGFIAFAIVAKKSIDGVLKNRWYTTPGVGIVKKTIKDGEELQQQFPDVIDNLINRVKDLESVIESGGTGGGGATKEQIEQIETNKKDIARLSEEIGDQQTQIENNETNILNLSKEVEGIKGTVFIEPLRIYYNAWCYLVESTGKLFVSANAYTDVFAYQLEAGKTYYFKADAPNGTYINTYVITQETLYDMPESGFNTGVNYKYINKESVAGRFEYKLTPDENCYIYVQVTNEGYSQALDYLNPYKNVYTQGFFAKFETQIDSLKKFAYSIENESEIMISQKYSNDIDIQFLLKRKGGNELFDFYKIYKIENTDNLPKVHDVVSATPFLSAVGDWHSPFQVKAVNNADGTQIDSNYFTGGNHQYNNSSSGSTATARSVSVDFIIDGIKMTSGNGYANEIVMKWVNNVQGYNTTKEDGAGREILQERHTMTLKDGIFHTYVELVPLEDVICNLWYGFQMFTTPYDTVQYIDGLNRTQFDFSAESTCGDKSASKVRFVNGDEDICEIKVNTSYDLGKRDNVTGEKGIFSTNYGKAYFSIINTPLSMVSGGVYSLEGEYIFRHGNF